MKVTRIVKAGIALCVVIYSGSVLAWGEDIAKHAITEAAGVAKASINQNKQETTISNSTLKNETKVENAIAVKSNLGISTRGDKVEIKNSTLVNKTEVQNAVLYGSNAGIETGNGK